MFIAILLIFVYSELRFISIKIYIGSSRYIDKCRRRGGVTKVNSTTCPYREAYSSVFEGADNMTSITSEGYLMIHPLRHHDVRHV